MRSHSFGSTNKKRFLKTLVAAVSASAALGSTAQVLEEVTVTAQKREQSMQDVPVSVSALGSSDMDKMGIESVKDIALMVPNLGVYSPYGDGGAPIFTLRGVTSSDYSQNQGRPVAMYIDEVHRGVGALEMGQMFDLERVEVLRGPQGTLYGKNATGGAINLVTKKPDFEKEGYVMLGLGNYNRTEVEGAYQAPLIDDVLAGRVAVTYLKTDGYVENVFPGGNDQNETDMWAARVNLLYTPVDNFEALLRINSAESTGENLGVYAGNADINFAGADRTGLDFHENNSNYSAEKEVENFGVALTMNWDFNDGHTLTSITAYDDGKWLSPEDDDGMEVRLDENEFSSPDVEQFTQEFRITSNYDGNFNWIGGVFWGEDTVDVINIIRLWNDPILGVDAGLGEWGFNQRNSFSQTRETLAAYLHTTYNLSDALTLTFGLRYTEDEVEVEDYFAAIGATLPGQLDSDFDIPTIANAGLDVDDDNTSVKLGLDWAVADDVLLYASFSQGYRGSAINAQAFYDPSEIVAVDPELLDAWELGIKSQFFGNRAQLNGAIFFYDYTDQQFLDTVEGGLQVLRNADKSEVLGFELEGNFLLGDSVNVRAGIGYLDAEYKELELGGVDLSGNKMIGSAEWNFNLSGDWRFAESDSGAFNLHVDTVFTDDTFFEAYNQPNLSQDGYWLLNGRLQFDSADDKYTIALWGKNLADEEYFVFGFDTAAYGLGFDTLGRGLPRTFGAEFTYRF